MQDFTFEGPLGAIECLVEPNRSERNAVLVMAHGFRGSRESGGRAAGIAYQCATHCSVVRFNFTGTRILSLQVAELRAVIAAVRERQPGCPRREGGQAPGADSRVPRHQLRVRFRPGRDGCRR